ncbi:MAG: serine hydrolase domain-containing protein [Pseudomonadales bacterium]
MRRLRGWVLVAALTLSGAAAADPVRELLDAHVPGQLAALDIPGAAIAVVRRGAEPLLLGYGVNDPLRGTPVDPERDLFRVGSVSKAVTATAVLDLVFSGAVTLEDDLGPLLRPLEVTPPLTGPLTLDHLLTHTAGFNERLFGQHVRSPAAVTGLDAYLRQHLPPRFIEPGRLIAYNDHHTVLAGWVLERLTARPFAAYVQQRLFEPLGMTSSTFEQVHIPDELAQRLTRAWNRDRNGFVPYARDYVLTSPAAGLYTTAADMARYLRALLVCPGGGLSAALCETQLATHFRHPGMADGRAYGFAEFHHGARRVLYKDGQATGFNARLLLVPEEGFGLFVVHNRNILEPLGRFAPASRFNRELSGALLQALWPTEPAAAPVPLPSSDAALRVASYAGSYRTVVAARHTWERIAGMFDDVRVRPTARGVMLGGDEYVEVRPGLLQWHAGGPRYIAFDIAADGAGGPAAHLFIGNGAYERVPWFLASWVTPWVLLGVVAWLLGYLVLARAHGPAPGVGLWRAGALADGLLLMFFAAMGALLAVTDPQVLFKGAPPLMLALLALPLAAAAILLVQLWRLRRTAPVRAKVLALANLAAGAAVLLWLDYWNLFGYRLG